MTTPRRPPTLLLMSNYSNRTGFAWNNIHRLFQDIMVAFADRGVGLCVSFANLEEPVEWLPPSLECEVAELRPVPRSLGGARRTIDLVRRLGVRYVYLTDQPLYSAWYAMLRLAGVRTILVHNRISVPDPRRTTEVDRSPKGMFKALVARSDLLSSDRVYAVSDFVRARLVLKARYPDEKVRVIMNGIDLERFRPSTPRPIDGRPVRIFTGARASRHKGIDVLVRAAERLRSRHGIGGFEVTYAGDGDQLPSLRRLVAELGLQDCFHFLGEVPSTERLQREADIIVVPSVWGDACPSSVSEGLASGKPVVATRVGGVPEIVGDEANALLVEPSDPDALAEALARLIRDPTYRQELGRRARLRAETALDQSRYHAEVIEQMLADCGLADGVGT